MTPPLAPDELEERLRAIAAARYHDKHPFHALLHSGRCTKAQVQAWALNRYWYQSRIPIKDATILARIEDPPLRRAWRQRIIDHDGAQEGEGGIARWLVLTDALGLPRDAVVNVIVRGDQAIPPRGSTRLREGDQVHVLLRQSEARRVPELVERWRSGPIGPAARPVRRSQGRTPVFSSWAWKPETDGDPAYPEAVRGQPVVAQLRIRRDERGGLYVLEDGRYAVTGPVAAIGGRGVLSQWARRRIPRAEPDERAWLQTVIGALASDVPE